MVACCILSPTMTKLFGVMIATFIVAIVSFGYVAFLTPPIISPLADYQPLNVQVLSMTIVTTPLTSPSPAPPSPTPTPATTPTPTPSPTPTPKPKPTPKLLPSPATATQMDAWFTEYANNQSVSIEMLRKIAICESGYNQFAQNGIYGGLFQFSTSTWKSTRGQMNADPNPDLRYNAEEAIKTAAFRFATSGQAAWPNCSK